MDAVEEDKDKSKYITMLNKIVNDLHILRADLHHGYPDKKNETALNWKMYWSDDWLSSAGEDVSLDSEADDERSDRARSQNGSLESDHGDTLPKDRSKKGPQVAMKPTTSWMKTSMHHNPLSPTLLTNVPDHRPISYLERVTKTHPVWFLPEISRAGAVHLLKDKEPGTFIVRRSSQRNTWALSIHQLNNNQSTVDHYLIEASNLGFTLQGSSHSFRDLPSLVAYYCQYIDELPERLVLPHSIRMASTTQELSSIALLGQDYWTLSRDRQKNAVERSNTILKFYPVNTQMQKSVSQPENMHTYGFQDANACRKKPFPNDSSQPSNTTTFQLKRNVSTNSINRNKVPVLNDCTSSMLNKETNCDNHAISSQSFKQSDTHLKSRPIHEVPCYHSTSMDMLLLPDQYHSSSLSDRMSDYSDVWKAGPNSRHRHSSDSSLEDNFVDAWSDVYSDSPSWTYHSPDKNVTDKIDTNNKSGVKIQNSHVNSSPERTPTTNDVFSYNKGDKTCTPYDNERKDIKTPGKPPPTPTKPIKRVRIRSNSSPAISAVSSFDYTEPYDCLDANSNEVFKLQSAYLRHPRSRLWLRRWSSLPFRLKSNEFYAEKSDQLSPFEAISPNLQNIALKNNFKTPSCQKIDVKNTQETRLNVADVTKPPQISPRSRRKIPDVTRGNSMKLDQNHISEVSRPNDLRLNPKQIQQQSNQSLQSPSSNKFPLYSSHVSAHSEPSTVCDIITKVAPELLIRNVKPLTVANLQQRASLYDNLSRQSRPVSLQTVTSTTTEYCTPWHSSFWDSILKGPPQRYVKGTSRLSQFTDTGSRTSLNSRDNNRLSLASQLSNNELINERLSNLGATLYDEASNQGSNPVSSQVPATNRSKDGTLRKQSYDASVGTRPAQFKSHNEWASDSQINVPYKTQSQLGSVQFVNPDFSTERASPRSSTKSSRNSDDTMKRSTRSVLSISIDTTEEVMPVGLHVDNDDDEDDDAFHDLGSTSLSSSQTGLATQLSRANKDCVCHVRDYLLKISQDQSTTFGSAIENFVKCTLESNETNAHVVMRNIRQFMNGIKNYLVTSGEGELAVVIEQERSKLNCNTILNIDAIIEGTLHRCVLRPLKYHVYRLLVDHYRTSGDLRLMSVNVKYARTLTPRQLGVPFGTQVPGRESMECIRHFIGRMQKAYSPLKKLEHFLSVVSAIYGSLNKEVSVKGSPVGLGADDFIPMLVYILVDCGLVSAEIEAEFMWGLLHPSILTGEGGYYLTTLSSVVLAIKNLRSAISDKHFTHNKTQSESKESCGFMRVVIPDELSDSIVWKTLPVRPNITTKDVCMMLAHKLKITNPQDYGLFSLHQGEESALKDIANPHTEHPDTCVKSRVFVYKRKAANIAWPKSFKPS